MEDESRRSDRWKERFSLYLANSKPTLVGPMASVVADAWFASAGQLSPEAAAVMYLSMVNAKAVEPEPPVRKVVTRGDVHRGLRKCLAAVEYALSLSAATAEVIAFQRQFPQDQAGFAKVVEVWLRASTRFQAEHQAVVDHAQAVVRRSCQRLRRVPLHLRSVGG